MSLNNLHPGLIMICFGCLILLLPEKCRRVLSVAAPVTAFAAFWQLNENSSLTYHVSDQITLHLIDAGRLAVVFLMVFCIIAIIAAVYSLDLQTKIEAAMCCFYVGSNMGIVLSGDLITLVVFWEISAFTSAYLIYARHCRKSSRAAFRYLLVHAFGGNMLLAGVIIHIFRYGTAITNISAVHDASFWLILIGVGVNAAVPPLNGWIADAYPEATIPGTVYLGSYTTKAAIYVMIRFFSGTEILIWVGAFMAIYAACMALMENDLRRLLSYHIVSQLGMMVASLAIGSRVGIDGASAHAVTNIFFKGVLLMGVGAIIHCTGKRKITELGGLYWKMPVVAICFLLSSMSIAGFPFLSGFASKALIMQGLHEAGLTIPALLITVAGVGTLLSITLKINYFVFFTGAEKDIPTKKVPYSIQIAMIAGTAMSFVIGAKPEVLYNRLAYQTMVDPFTLPHILEYVAIIIGGTIPFALYIYRIAPHDEISIDFDWFYRRPLFRLVKAASGWIYSFMEWCSGKSLHNVQYLGSHIGNPYLWTKNSSSVRIRSLSFENEDRWIGTVITQTLAALLIMVIGAIVII